MRLHTLRQLLTAVILLTATASCYNYDQDDVINLADNHFINVTISVSTSDAPATRAPLGGEYGDGWEKGVDRENEIKNITLIFYTDVENGINANSDDSKVVCVKNYTVRRFESTDEHNHKPTEPTSNYYNQEVLYTTGNQRLEETQLEIGKSYKVLVVANAIPNVTVGERIIDVRDKMLSTVYTGTGLGITASEFVMTSETDASVMLDNPTKETVDGENRMIYYFGCIHIERLAARIDYNPTGSTYSTDYNGYKYDETNGNGFFVVTKVTPFNLYDENEYYFKRVRNNWTDETPAISYLADESKTNYVVDPNTGVKTSNTLSYLNPLTSLTSNLDGDFTQEMSAVQETDQISNRNVIIGYVKENTLHPNSLLKTYATGIAFEVKYYENSTTTNPVTKVYYHYLRHQGENVEGGSYQAKKLDDLVSDTQTCGDTPMNFGIVRNNIYRVSVESLTPDNIILYIKVKKWDKFVHAPIYM